MPKNDWNAYRELFLHEMKENGKQFAHISTALDSLHEEFTAMKVDIRELKVKAAIAGGVAGLVVTGLLSAITRLWK